MKEPESVSDLRRFLGMCNQFNKFAPELAEATKPLRDLLGSKNQWIWDQPQRKAFAEVKSKLSSTLVLCLYDHTKPTKVSADASSFGMGAVLMQKQSDGHWQPVAYCSRSLTSTEQKYTQIEKEALAVIWACERFTNHLLGMNFEIETDHKPLVPLLGQKLIDELPLRIQRFRMRLMKFSYQISHVAGKNLVIADTLSRAPVAQISAVDQEFTKEVDAYVNMIVSSLPATDVMIRDIKSSQSSDATCQKIHEYLQGGWPHKSRLPNDVKPFMSVSTELSLQDGLLMRGSRIVVPQPLRADILQRIHSGHQGITKCRARASQSVWWPGMSKEIENLVRNCTTCCKTQVQFAEPLITTNFPKLPWQRVGTDLFEYKGTQYVLVIDYFSRYIEIAKLSSTSSDAIITHLKSMFARHGIPQYVVSDNGPQYSSEIFCKFAKDYGFIHITSSPKYPQSNGEAERAVRTIKSLLKKADDKKEDRYLALMAYHATPLECGYSPAELLMSRRVRANIPTTQQQLLPKVPQMSFLLNKDKAIKLRQKQNFNERHNARPLSTLQHGEKVWLSEEETMATVQSDAGTRSYNVNTESGSTLRRNRRQLVAIPEEENIQTEQNSTDSHQPAELVIGSPDTRNENISEQSDIKRTSSGRVTKPPKRFRDEL